MFSENSVGGDSNFIPRVKKQRRLILCVHVSWKPNGRILTSPLAMYFSIKEIFLNKNTFTIFWTKKRHKSTGKLSWFTSSTHSLLSRSFFVLKTWRGCKQPTQEHWFSLSAKDVRLTPQNSGQVTSIIYLCSFRELGGERGTVRVKYRVYSIKRPGRLLNFWTLSGGAYSRWALIRGGALNRINTISCLRIIFTRPQHDETKLLITLRCTRNSFINLWKQCFSITYTKFLRHCNDIPLGSTSAISCTSSGIPISWGYFSSYHTRSSAPTEISLKAR